MIHALFAVLVLLALLGDARIFLFIFNRLVIGGHRHERSPWKPLIFIVPPALLFLTILSWRFRFTSSLDKLGTIWLIVAAAIGIHWIVNRIHAHFTPDAPLSGVESRPSPPSRWLHNEVYDLEVTRHEIFIDDLPEPFDGYRIAFLTDTHVAPMLRASFFRDCVAQTGAFDPDLVLLGGDFVTWGKHIPLAAELLLTDLSARDGVFAVLGNHDYWAGAGEMRQAFEAHGVQFLINRALPLRRGGSQIWLIGIDEAYRGEPDVQGTFADVDPAEPCIGLSHHPDIIDNLDGRRVDLLLCGHTHGGQIRFPFFGSIVVPSRHEGEYALGFHRVRNVLMYVSRGIGAIPPLRILCRPEVATFVLRRGRRT